MARKIDIARHLTFTVGFIGVTFGACALSRAYSIKQYQERKTLSLKELIGFNSPPAVIYKERTILPQFLVNIKEMIRINYEQAHASQKLAWGLILANALVFAAWRIPNRGIMNFMPKYFMHTPVNNRPVTMLTCVFSHYSGAHFIFNMMALNSLLPFYMDSQGMSPEQGLAAYLSAGVFSSFASHLISSRLPGRGSIGGLGASGAIWGLLSGCAITNPDSRLGIIFIPGVHFKMSELVPAFVALDLAGLILGWSRFDHAAHLGGAAFGLLYSLYGVPLWSQVQREIIAYRQNKH